jgi:acyl carrier protein
LTAAIVEQIRVMASDLFGVPLDRISPASSPANIETWDSTAHLNLVLALEERFAFQILPEEMERMQSIADVTRLVESKLQSAAGQQR